MLEEDVQASLFCQTGPVLLMTSAQDCQGLRHAVFVETTLPVVLERDKGAMA